MILVLIKNNKASLSLEASISVSCIIFFMIFLISFTGLKYTEELLEESIVEASLNVRTKCAFVIYKDELKAKNRIFKNIVHHELIKSLEKRKSQMPFFSSKKFIIDVSGSEYNSGNLKMCVDMDYDVLFFNKSRTTIHRTLYFNSFTYFREPFKFLREQGTSEVYLADHPSVYHTYRDCRSIKGRNATPYDLSDLKGEYRECKFCQKRRLK